ncbi:FadR/GntR family transcriptional regulator [Burkholderia anthina]|uniref:FadR/GntR family transcriptional regulator n=1 Tax=Burkholderia anthina TaxID=179879 RepID=UPI00158EE5DD|nr:GntR family transcriptional regulator [Burkholderia anthina]
MLWGLQPVEQQPAYGLAVEVLRRQVHLGHLEAAERLPPERSLAEQLGVSRVTLREALRVLEAEGYFVVRRGPQGGTFVNDVDALRELSARRIGRDPGMVMRVLEFRDANETTAARLAAARRTPTDLSNLEAALKPMRADDAPARLRRAEAMFHLAIGDASHNPLLAKSIEEAHAALFVVPDERGNAALKKRVLDTRERLFAAIRDRRGQDAEEAAKDVIAADRARMQVLARIA